MNKMNYEYGGNVYEIDKELVDKWAEREGIVEGEQKFHNAMACVIGNAEGRLRLQNILATKETVEQAMEEIIKEEIELTGGEV